MLLDTTYNQNNFQYSFYKPKILAVTSKILEKFNLNLSTFVFTALRT
jgi:hypothetical protein